MGELVDQQDVGVTLESGIEIEFFSDDPAVFDGLRWKYLEAFQQTLGVSAAVRFDVADNDVTGVCRSHAAGGFEHGVCFAYAGGRAKEDAQTPAFGAGFFGLNVG
jgi:hypothetical protein